MTDTYNLSLTPEQRDIYIKNVPLIYHVLKKLNCVETAVCDYDDYFQRGAMSLCRAIMCYDPSDGTAFSTYACKAIERGILREYETSLELIEHEDRFTFLDTTEPMLSGSEKCDDVLDLGATSVMLERSRTVYNKEQFSREFNEVFYQILNDPYMPPKKRKFVETFLLVKCCGYTHEQIAAIEGVSHQSIAVRVIKGQKYLAENRILREFVGLEPVPKKPETRGKRKKVNES